MEVDIGSVNFVGWEGERWNKHESMLRQTNMRLGL